MSFNGLLTKRRYDLWSGVHLSVSTAQVITALGQPAGRLGPAGDRVSRGWRICFVWQDGDAFEVELNNHYD